MAFDWSSFLQDEYCTIGQFVENVVYGEYEKYDTNCLNYDIFAPGTALSCISDLVHYIDRISTKDSVIKELELTLLLYQDAFVINSMQGQYSTFDGGIVLDDDRILHLKNFIHTYKEDAFPYMKNERNNIRMLDNGRIGLQSSSYDSRIKTYLTTELARALLRYHHEHKFVAPQSFLDCFGQKETQSRSICKTSNREMPQGRYVDVPVLLERWDMRAFELANIARRHGADLFNPLGSLFDFSLLDELNSYDQKVIHEDILKRSLLRADAIRIEKEVGLLSTAEAQLPLATPPTQGKAEPIDKPIHSKRRTTYLKFICGLLGANNLRIERNPQAQRDTTASDIQKVLDTAGIDLDTDTIKSVLREIKESEIQ